MESLEEILLPDCGCVYAGIYWELGAVWKEAAGTMVQTSKQKHPEPAHQQSSHLCPAKVAAVVSV